MKKLFKMHVSGRTREACEVARGEFDEKYRDYVFKEYHNIPGSFYVFEEDFPYLQEFLRDAEQLNIECRIHWDFYFTQSEINKLPFYHMILRAPFESEGCPPEYYGTQYDEDHCNRCHFGGQLKGDLLVDRKFMKNCKIGSFYSHQFIKEEFIPILKSSGLTGITYSGNVSDYKGREMPAFKLFEIENILPPISKATCLEKYRFPCDDCGYQITYLYGTPAYEREKLEGALDFNWSHEIFNNWNQRKIIVSAKVKQVFRENKIRAYFRPIYIMD